MACPLIGQQLVALLAAALEAAHCVPTYVITPPVVQATLINICGQKTHTVHSIHFNALTGRERDGDGREGEGQRERERKSER